MKVYLFLAIFILLVSQSSAISYINIYLDEKGEAVFMGTSSESSLPLPDGISLSDGKILGKTSYLTKSKGDIISFSFSLNDSEIELILPKGALLKNASSSEIFPRGDYFSIYSKDTISVSYVDDSTSFSLTIVLIILIFLIALLLFIYLYASRRLDPSDSTMLKNLLNDRQKAILSELRKSGKVKMSYLRKKCDIPKASFSRHVQELEKKKLILRSGLGKNKYVEILDK